MGTSTPALAAPRYRSHMAAALDPRLVDQEVRVAGFVHASREPVAAGTALRSPWARLLQ